MRFLAALVCAATLAAFTGPMAHFHPADSKNKTTTTLSAEPNPATVGEDVALTATVAKSSGAGSPTGSVTFSVDAVKLKTVALSPAGVGNFTASTNQVHPGTYPVIATYSGDKNFIPSTSASDSIKLDPAPTRTTLSVSATSITPPASDSLTATVVRSTSGVTGTPTGSVTFLADGHYALATIKLNTSGVANFTASSKGVPPNTYAITARYNHDASNADSTSAAIDVTVK